MDHGDFLEAIAHQGEAFAVAADGNLSAAVRSCPGWRVSDLVWHLGEVHDFWRTIVEGRLGDPDLVPKDLARPDDEDLVAWYRSGLGRLGTVLAEAGPDTPCWTWSPRKDSGFVTRRMAQETAVHGWDARAAAGEDASIDVALAVDGVEEFLDHWLTGSAGDGEPIAGSVHLHATDADGEWQVTPEGSALVVSRQHAKGTAAVRARASDLLLLLWRRKRPVDPAYEVFGDEAVLARFLAHANLD